MDSLEFHTTKHVTNNGQIVIHATTQGEIVEEETNVQNL